MNILLIEDDEHKARQIIEFLKQNKEIDYNVTEKKSYQSGIKEIIKGNYDAILLDMSMPAFDRSPNRLTSSFRHFAGRDVLMELDRRDILIETIVVTQFDVFGEGQKEINAKDLDRLLENQFPLLYKGMIHFDASLSSWKNDLEIFLNNIKDRKKT